LPSPARSPALATGKSYPATLPPGPLSVLSLGQSDLYPFNAPVDIYTVKHAIFNFYEQDNPLNLLAGRFDLAFCVRISSALTGPGAFVQCAFTRKGTRHIADQSGAVASVYCQTCVQQDPGSIDLGFVAGSRIIFDCYLIGWSDPRLSNPATDSAVDSGDHVIHVSLVCAGCCR
jgi:hypothetical protein